MLSTLLLTNCQQLAKQFKVREGERVVLHTWVLGTKFFDKVRGKKYPGKTKVYVLGREKLRMDVFDPFGFVTVGTLILNGDMMSLETVDGKSYKGPKEGQKVRDFLKVHVNPKDLFSLFLQNGFEDKHWSCAVDAAGSALKECVSGLHKLNILWSGRTTQKGTEILLEHERAKVRFQVKSYKPYENRDTELFDI